MSDRSLRRVVHGLAMRRAGTVATSIEVFLRLTGRGSYDLQDAMSIKASSSDRSRQPRLTRPAHNVLFRIGGRWKDQGAP